MSKYDARPDPQRADLPPHPLTMDLSIRQLSAPVVPPMTPAEQAAFAAWLRRADEASERLFAEDAVRLASTPLTR